MDAYNITNRIEELRKERGWSVYKLAEESGLTQSTLFNMRVRKTLPSITTLICLCDAFGVTLSEFFAEGDESSLSYDEKKLVESYRRLPYKSRQAVLGLVESLGQTK